MIGYEIRSGVNSAGGFQGQMDGGKGVENLGSLITTWQRLDHWDRFSEDMKGANRVSTGVFMTLFVACHLLRFQRYLTSYHIN